jgi:hypothetical protein
MQTTVFFFRIEIKLDLRHQFRGLKQKIQHILPNSEVNGARRSKRTAQKGTQTNISLFF